MPTISIPIERFLFGNEHWRSQRAIDEIKIYCDLLEFLQDRLDCLVTRGKSEEVTLTNAQAVISSYAVEIGLKSLWALDNPANEVPKTHNLAKLYQELKPETVEGLCGLGLTHDEIQESSSPFVTNRYSMEERCRDIVVFRTEFLELLAQLVQSRLEESRKALFRPDRPGGNDQ